MNEEESPGKAIFNAHQAALAQWTTQVVDHQVSLRGVLDQSGNNSSSSSSPRTIQLLPLCPKRESALRLFAAQQPQQPQLETKRKLLLALCFVLTELDSVCSRIEDGEDEALLGSVQQVSERVLALLHNLTLQLQACCAGKSGQEALGPLAALTVVWKSIARAIACLVRLETTHKLQLLAHGLQFLGQQVGLSPVVEHAGKVLKLWISAAFTSFHVMECVCLLVYISRTNLVKDWERKDWVRKLEGLFVQVSPNLPIFKQRRCVRAEELLYDHFGPGGIVPAPEHFATLRLGYAKTLVAGCSAQASRLSHDALFAVDRQHEVAQRLFHLVFNVLFTHVLTKQPLPKDSLPPLLLCLEALHALGQQALVPSPLPPSPPTADPFHLWNASPSGICSTARAVAINLCFPQPSVLYSFGDHVRAHARMCNVATLFQAFPELFDPLFKLKLDLGSTLDYGAISTAFPQADVANTLVRHVTVQVDSVLRSRLVMRTTMATTLAGLEQQKLAIQTLLSASASVRQQVEFDLANSWQAMRTSGIDRTWDTYCEMQHMASEYFGLHVYLDESFRGTPGVDLVELAEQDDFYSRFKYNLDFACFVERKRVGKQLQVVSIATITQSLDSAGWGAVPTIVNLVYQFLAKRLSVLALVVQQVKKYRKSSARGLAYFKFDVALEQCAEAKPVWSQLRTLLTEIGNGFGLVRNLGLASKQQQQQQQQPQLTQDSLQVLVNVFAASALREQLKGFFLLVPALCVEFVDSNLAAKEAKLGVASSGEGVASNADDGFVLGVAALLAILQQQSQFDAIKFFAGVTQYLAARSSSTAAAPSRTTTNSKPLVDSATATFQMRHRGLAREYELLMYGLAASRICFK